MYLDCRFLQIFTHTRLNFYTQSSKNLYVHERTNVRRTYVMRKLTKRMGPYAILCIYVHTYARLNIKIIRSFFLEKMNGSASLNITMVSLFRTIQITLFVLPLVLDAFLISSSSSSPSSVILGVIMRSSAMSLSCTNEDLLSLVQQGLPESKVDSLEIVGDSIQQANAEGMNVQVKIHDNSSLLLLFVKRIHADVYASKKSWTDLRRTLIYARTEIRFYQHIVPLISQKFSLIPHCYLSNYDLDGLIGEDECATDVNNLPMDPDMPTQNKGGALLLQSMKASEEDSSSSNQTYFQTSPLTIDQAKQCLVAVAQLHASAWEDPSILKLVSTKLAPFGGSYHLKIRNPKELQGLVSSWNKFTTAFEDFPEMKELLQSSTNIQKIGQRVYDMAEYICNELSPNYQDNYATLVHGDYKAMNVFLPKNSYDYHDVKIIDYASTGIGMAMSDVAFHITHALTADDIQHNEEDLLRTYLNALHSANPYIQYSYEEAFQHYMLATVDYFRFICGRFWKSATPETFEVRKNSVNTVLVNRNLPAAIAFIQRVDKYLTIIEHKFDQNQQKA